MSKNLRIKFSHRYDKMLNNETETVPKKAVLMEVFTVNKEDLHPRFIEYDTSYWEGIKHFSYKLPEGKLIILLLYSEIYGMTIGSRDIIWTTIRRYTEKKYEYYRKNRWEEFKIIIEKEK